jgi:hypothetical protein
LPVLWITWSTRRRRAGEIRDGHLGTPGAHGVGGVVIDRVVPIWREKELRGPVCKLDKIPAR